MYGRESRSWNHFCSCSNSVLNNLHLAKLRIKMREGRGNKSKEREAGERCLSPCHTKQDDEERGRERNKVMERKERTRDLMKGEKKGESTFY